MSENNEESLVSHLEALRMTLIKCFAALGLCLFPLFFVAPYGIDLLINIMSGGQDVTLNYFTPMEVFILQIKMAVVLDLLICFPYIARQIWIFVLPGLYENERRFIRSIVLFSAGLFVFGAVFCLFFILPLIMNFGLSFASESIHAVFGISNIVSLAMWLCIVFGLMFQFPLITYFLLRWHIVSYAAVKDKRPYVFVALLVLSALLTPPDIVSQLMLSIPTYLLFEAGLFLGRHIKPQE